MNKRREFGKWLQGKRQDVGLSQRQASEQLGFSNSCNVIGYENGTSPVPLKRLFDISEVYKIPMSELLEQLEDCEPRLYNEFIELDEKFKKRYEMQFTIFRSGGNIKNIQGAEIAMHHRPFRLLKKRRRSDNNAYVNYSADNVGTMYIM